MKIDNNLDLVLERELDITPEQVFKGYTNPELLRQWFCPKPWSVAEAKIDLKPGGQFLTIMQSPEGDKFPNEGCFLEIIPNKKLVWTNLLLSEFRPAPAIDLMVTCTILLEACNGKTFYKAIASHRNEEERKKHEAMGFQQGWGMAADQLVQLMKSQQ